MFSLVGTHLTEEGKMWSVAQTHPDGVWQVQQDGSVEYSFGPETEDKRLALELVEILNRCEVYRA